MCLRCWFCFACQLHSRTAYSKNRRVCCSLLALLFLCSHFLTTEHCGTSIMRLVPLRRAALYATSRVVMGNAAVVTSGAAAAAARASSSAAARGCLTSGSPSVRWVAKGRREGGNHVSLRTRQRQRLQLQQQQQQQRCATTMTSAVPTSMMSSRAPALTSTKLRTHTCGELRLDALQTTLPPLLLFFLLCRPLLHHVLRFLPPLASSPSSSLTLCNCYVGENVSRLQSA